MLTQDIIQLFCQKILQTPNLTLSPFEMNELIFPARKFQIIGWYGKGESGIILQVESIEDSKLYALKVVGMRKFETDAQALREFEIQKRFAEYNMAPNIYVMDVRRSTIRNTPVQFVRVLMDPIDRTLLQCIRDQPPVERKKVLKALLCLVRKKFLLAYPYPFLHSDMHFNNIVLLQDQKTLGFIDFGLTVRKPALCQLLDVIPLVTSLKMQAQILTNRFQRDACLSFARDVIRLYDKFFKIQLDFDRFEAHPTAAYRYVSEDGTVLHSYDWAPDARLQRTPPSTEEDIRRVFPGIEPPKIIP